jgi:hypothetical protein
MSALVAVVAGRWRARPGLARACRVAAFLGPVVAVTLVASIAIKVLPLVAGAIPQLLCWVLTAMIGLTGAVLSERLLSRLLPIATLLDLDIGFPSASPTRLRIASLASLHPRDADPADLLPGAAQHDLDAAAESVLIRYATRVRPALQPRSHLERVRLLTMLVAARLGLNVEDRDRLQWALLLREIGSFDPDERTADHQLTAWLGPWAALLHGPFIAVTQKAQAPQIVMAAHAAAVADVYAVVSASHPYRRGIGAGHPGARLKAIVEHHLLPEAVDALLTVPAKRLRKAVGITAGASPLVERLAPAPQPILAATAILVVLAVAAEAPGPTPTIAAETAAEAAQHDAGSASTERQERGESAVGGESVTPSEEPSDDTASGHARRSIRQSRPGLAYDGEGGPMHSGAGRNFPSWGDGMLSGAGQTDPPRKASPEPTDPAAGGGTGDDDSGTGGSGTGDDGGSGTGSDDGSGTGGDDGSGTGGDTGSGTGGDDGSGTGGDTGSGTGGDDGSGTGDDGTGDSGTGDSGTGDDGGSGTEDPLNLGAIVDGLLP